MKPSDLDTQYVGRVLPKGHKNPYGVTRQVSVGTKPGLRLHNLSIIAIATVLLSCIPNTHAANLGRLFFTPEQRAQLDYTYARNAPAEGNASPILTVNGIVQKNGGARTVWVNGVSQNAGKGGERNPAAQTVTVPGKSRPVKLKVGDRMLLDQPAPTGQHLPLEQP